MEFKQIFCMMKFHLNKKKDVNKEIKRRKCSRVQNDLTSHHIYLATQHIVQCKRLRDTILLFVEPSTS